MSFPHIKVTDVGRLLLSKVLAGASIEFSYFMLGNGACPNPDDWDGLTAPISPVMKCNITKFSRVDDKVVLQGEFSNANVPEAFLWYELCIFASIPDDEEYQNVMVFYGNADALAEYVPGPDSTAAVTHRWDTTIALSSSASVSAMVQSITYATLAQLSEHTNNQANPHNVTKKQIGLDKVENYAPSDPPIIFTDTPEVITELQSGEPLWKHIARSARAIVGLIAHLRDNKNPHQVTADQAGAAPKNHQSANATYGLGNATKFGHVKLTDGYTGGETAGDGVAVTPKALSAAHDALSAYNSSYNGTGNVYTGTFIQRYGTPVYVQCVGTPKVIIIQGTVNAKKHIAFLRINGTAGSGIAFVDGEVVPLTVDPVGNTLNGMTDVTYYVHAAETDGVTPAKQMNLAGEVYNYTAIF